MENKTMMQYFEWYLPDNGLLWKRCKENAKELKEAGIDMLWLPPAYKGMQAGDVGYGVYDLYDLGEFNQKGTTRTKYGTKEEYIEAIKELQKEGIEVLADIVFNHKMGADECEEVLAVPCDFANRERRIGTSCKIKAWTKFSFPGRNGKYSDFEWNYTHFSGTDWDDGAKKKALYLFEGKNWNRDTDEEFVNFDYLMGADLDTDNKEVVEELLKFGQWYLETAGMDGFRLDAVKHISSKFYRDYLKKLREITNKELFSVGEYWHPGTSKLLEYLDETENTMSLFDVPLHYNFYNISNGNSQFDMRKLFENTLVGTRAQNAVTFVDNHDTQPGQALCSYVSEWFKPLAYAAILLRESGIPCVFYGDYYGLPNCGKEPVEELKTLLQLRKKYAYGEQKDYFDHENIIGWVRKGDEKHKFSGMAVLLSDGPGGSKRMDVGKCFSGMKFYDVVGKCTEPVLVGEDGFCDFYVDGGTVSVWVCQGAYEELYINA